MQITRAEVLKAEAVIAPTQGPNCALSGGQWYSPYEGRYLDGPRGLDIDHLVPLAEAWDSGASAWTAGEREAYANDLGDGRALIAVSASSNRSKADQDPSTWLPSADGYRCTYAINWVADKTRWGLSVDLAERATLEDVLSRCPDVPVTVTPACDLAPVQARLWRATTAHPNRGWRSAGQPVREPASGFPDRRWHWGQASDVGLSRRTSPALPFLITNSTCSPGFGAREKTLKSWQ